MTVIVITADRLLPYSTLVGHDDTELCCVRLPHNCGSPPGVMMADTLSFNAKIGVVDF